LQNYQFVRESVRIVALYFNKLVVYKSIIFSEF
jgi:hypothetical protein